MRAVNPDKDQAEMQRRLEEHARRRVEAIKEQCATVPEEWRGFAETFLLLAFRIVDAVETPLAIEAARQPLSTEEAGGDPDEDGPWMRENTRHGSKRSR